MKQVRSNQSIEREWTRRQARPESTGSLGGLERKEMVLCLETGWCNVSYLS